MLGILLYELLVGSFILLLVSSLRYFSLLLVSSLLNFFLQVLIQELGHEAF